MASLGKHFRSLVIRLLILARCVTKDALPASTAPDNQSTTTSSSWSHQDFNKDTNTATIPSFLSLLSLSKEFKMSRRSRYDEDVQRLPEGMKRVGYNSNTQRYTFQDQNEGSFWEGPEGSRFGRLVQSLSFPIPSFIPPQLY